MFILYEFTQNLDDYLKDILETCEHLKDNVAKKVVGHHNIVDKSSAYGAKGPGFNTRCGRKFNCAFE